jgi:hypothetical protein
MRTDPAAAGAAENQMKNVLIVATLLAGSSFATPSLADIEADYLAACLGASNNNAELCACKTQEAVKVADEEMLGFIVIALSDNPRFRAMVNQGEVPEAVIAKWPTYVRQTNAICIPPAN